MEMDDERPVEPEVAEGIEEMDPEADAEVAEDSESEEDSDSDSSAETIELSDDAFPELPDGWDRCTKSAPEGETVAMDTQFYWDQPPNPDERWTLDYKWDEVELGEPTIDDTDFSSCVHRWISDEWLDHVTSNKT